MISVDTCFFKNLSSTIQQLTYKQYSGFQQEVKTLLLEVVSDMQGSLDDEILRACPQNPKEGLKLTNFLRSEFEKAYDGKAGKIKSRVGKKETEKIKKAFIEEIADAVNRLYVTANETEMDDFY